jgi:hypothetical protein
VLGPVYELLLESVIDAVKLTSEIVRRTAQKPTQGLRVWLVGQSREVLKRSIGSEK